MKRKVTPLFLAIWAALLLLAAGCSTTEPARDDAAPASANAPEAPALRDIARVLDQLAGYQFGDTPAWRSQLLHAFQKIAGDPDLSRAAERLMLDFLQSDASTEAKRVLVSELAVLAGERARGMLPGLATSEGTTAELAVDVLLRSKLLPAAEWVALYPRLPDAQRVPVITAVGRRGDGDAADFLEARARAGDEAVRAAALDALGELGRPEADEALMALREQVPMEDWAHARVRLADRLREEGYPAVASRIYEQLNDPGFPLPVRRAALAGAFALAEEPARWLLDTIAGMDSALKPHALRLARDLPPEFRSGRRFFALDGLNTADRLQLLMIFSRRADASVLPQARDFLREDAPELRVAAIEALAHIGTAAEVPSLLRIRAGDDRDLARLAEDALARMTDPEVNNALTGMAGDPSRAPDPRAAAVETLVDRHARDALPALVDAWDAEVPAVREEAVLAVGMLAGLDRLPALVALHESAEDAGLRRAAEQAVYRLCLRQREAGAVARALRQNPAPGLEDTYARIRERMGVVDNPS